MIDFKTDPRFNVPDSANISTMPVEITARYVGKKFVKDKDPIFYVGGFNNRDTALIELRKVAKEWKKEGGVTEIVNPETLKLLNGKFETIAFYYIDLLPYDGKMEEWDK